MEAGTVRKFRFMTAAITAQNLCIVNKNAIVPLTVYQKYDGFFVDAA